MHLVEKDHAVVCWSAFVARHQQVCRYGKAQCQKLQRVFLLFSAAKSEQHHIFLHLCAGRISAVSPADCVAVGCNIHVAGHHVCSCVNARSERGRKNMNRFIVMCGEVLRRLEFGKTDTHHCLVGTRKRCLVVLWHGFSLHHCFVEVRKRCIIASR